MRQNLPKLFESVYQEICLAMVMSGKRMRSLDGPLNVVHNVGKEFPFVAGLKFLEDFANMVECNCRFDVSFLIAALPAAIMSGAIDV
jgi:hypothetical protein